MTKEDDKISNIYQQSKKEGNEQGPSLDLDNAILKSAHDAVEQAEDDISDEFSKVKSPFAGGWHAKISIAALLLITVIIVPLIEQEETQSPDLGKLDMYEQVKKKLEKMHKLSEERDSVSRLKTKEQAANRAVQSPMVNSSPQATSNAAPKAAMKVETSKKRSPMQRQILKQEMKFIPYSADAVESNSSSSSNIHAIEVEAIEMESTPMMNNTTSTPTSFSNESTFLLDTDANSNLLSAESWLNKIRQLLEDDEFDHAKLELEQFKLVYPQEMIDPLILQQIAERH